MALFQPRRVGAATGKSQENDNVRLFRLDFFRQIIMVSLLGVAVFCSIYIRWAGDGWFVHDGAWQLRTTLDVGGRALLNGRMNTSPRAQLPLLPITVQQGCDLSFSFQGESRSGA